MYRHSKSVADYILQRIATPESGCWEWSRGKDRDGYGQCIGCKWYYLYGKSRSHQLVYIAFIGPIPDGMLVCHTCDNRRCCRPSHLWLGTVADNNTDMMVKGRHRPPKLSEETRKRIGDKHRGKKLTPAHLEATRRNVPVMTPRGWFKSIKFAAESFGRSPAWVQVRLDVAQGWARL